MINRDLLLVIDMQNAYTKGGVWECPNIYRAADNIKTLIDVLGSDKLDTIFTKFIASETPSGNWVEYNKEHVEINSDLHANEIIDIFKDYCGTKYPLYSKSVYSSYAIPEVVTAIENCSGNVVLSGVVADCCVLSTAFALIDAGVHIIYLTDAVAGIDEKTETAAMTVLKGLSPLHVDIMTTNEYATSKLKEEQ